MQLMADLPAGIVRRRKRCWANYAIRNCADLTVDVGGTSFNISLSAEDRQGLMCDVQSTNYVLPKLLLLTMVLLL